MIQNHIKEIALDLLGEPNKKLSTDRSCALVLMAQCLWIWKKVRSSAMRIMKVGERLTGKEICQ